MKTEVKKRMSVAKITELVGHSFRSFGGGKGSNNNPIAEALKDKPFQFAAGVDIREVVKFVIKKYNSK